jgi:hypothetical protein
VNEALEELQANTTRLLILRQKVAAKAGVPVSHVALEVRPGSVLLVFTIAVPDAAGAASVGQALEHSFASVRNATSALEIVQVLRSRSSKELTNPLPATACPLHHLVAGAVDADLRSDAAIASAAAPTDTTLVIASADAAKGESPRIELATCAMCPRAPSPATFKF